MIRTVVCMAVLLVGARGWGSEVKVPEGPAAQRGWIVVVRSSEGGLFSGRVTDELPGKYATRDVKEPSGRSIQVFDNLKMIMVTSGKDEWSVVASRWYQGVGNLTHLAFLDPPSPEFSDQQALELLLAYRSFTFGELTHVIYCPPRARLTWQGEFSLEPIMDGECKANATLTIALDKRTPTVLSGKLIKVERGLGRILVSQVGK